MKYSYGNLLQDSHTGAETVAFLTTERRLLLSVSLLSIIPTNLISYVTGYVSRLRFPFFIQSWLNRIFVNVFGINMQEAAAPLSEFSSIEDVFVRKLKVGARPIASSVVSPADGFLARSAAIERGCMLQAKGIDYSVGELVGRGEMSAVEAAWFTTIYLAPHNYHRVHSPMSGVLQLARYIPGQLWPVNKPFVRNMPKLFSRNERLVFEIAVDGGGMLYAVMVGALNVGRVQMTARPEFVSNSLSRQIPFCSSPTEMAIKMSIKAGDELGTFMLGSTVVLVFDQALKSRFRFVQKSENSPIVMGQSLIEEPS